MYHREQDLPAVALRPGDHIIIVNEISGQYAGAVVSQLRPVTGSKVQVTARSFGRFQTFAPTAVSTMTTVTRPRADGPLR